MHFKELKNKIKEEQKTLAQNIRTCRSLRKPDSWESASEKTLKLCRYNNYSYQYRHKHIAYCQFFNKTPYEEIERSCNEGPNASIIDKYMKEWYNELEEDVRDCA